MSYNNILVAVDFDNGTLDVLNRAVGLAKATNAKVSLVHVVSRISDGTIFSGLIDTELVGVEATHPMTIELNQKLDDLVEKIDYPITHRYVINGNLTYDLRDLVKEIDVDLIVFGHHNNFWSRLTPSVGGLINTSPVDLLVVSLED
ncbi:universal stress global response regulator UspA [Psychromonas sp. RZ22]|uniref:universal stress protein n=1 Tax=Psychromonas algarum TaxID=2555643 RepID=UPI001068B964|nr:universal stress protein [Psychromonas sp. RZ22]TEW56836.1 universal stress global response regulator UspA [Psychromonas sp. RZ22]